MRKTLVFAVTGLVCLLHPGVVTAQSPIPPSKSTASKHVGHNVRKFDKADAVETNLESLILRLKKQGRLGKVHTERNPDGSLKSMKVEVRAAPSVAPSETKPVRPAK